MVKKIIKKVSKKEEKVVMPLQATDEELAEAKEKASAEKEARRKMLLDLQATCDREHIHSLSDIEFKLAELDRQ